jgi:hypothetical protein
LDLSSPDHLEVNTGNLVKAGSQLQNIQSDAKSVSETAQAMAGTIGAPEAGTGIGAAATEMATAWGQGFDLIGGELAALGGNVSQSAMVYEIVDNSAAQAIGALMFTAQPAI